MELGWLLAPAEILSYERLPEQIELTKFILGKTPEMTQPEVYLHGNLVKALKSRLPWAERLEFPQRVRLENFSQAVSDRVYSRFLADVAEKHGEQQELTPLTDDEKVLPDSESRFGPRNYDPRPHGGRC